METTASNPVTLTENAIKEVKRIMETNSVSGGGLRVGVTGGVPVLLTPLILIMK